MLSMNRDLSFEPLGFSLATRCQGFRGLSFLSGPSIVSILIIGLIGSG
jgi:hypothetical protein